MSRIKFTPRASPVLAEHRNIYKISQILLILHFSCRGAKASLPKLQLFNWAMKDRTRQELLIHAAKTSKLNINAWGFDPILTIALNFAVAENLIKITTTGYELTEFGLIFVNEIIKDIEVLTKEKEFLKSVSKSVGESMIDEVTKNWVMK